MAETPISTPPPELIANKPIREATARMLKMREEARQASARCEQLESSRQGAVEEDRAAYATALKAGKGDPGQPQTEAHDKQIAAGRRRREAAEHAVAELTAAYVAEVEKQRDRWRQSIDQQLDKTRAAYLAAVDELARAHGDLSLAAALAGYLANFDKPRWRPEGYAQRAGDLKRLSGDPQLVAEVLPELRKVAAPRPPRPPESPHVAPGGPWPAQGLADVGPRAA